MFSKIFIKRGFNSINLRFLKNSINLTVNPEKFKNTQNEFERILLSNEPQPQIDIDNSANEVLNNLITKRRYNYDIQSFGLVVLLVGEIGNFINSHDSSIKARRFQKTLAECVELQQQAFKTHELTENFQMMPQHGNEIPKNSSKMNFQKLKLLIGDLLHAKSSQKLAELREQNCIENVMESMKNHIEAEFIGDRDDQNFPLPSDPQFESQFTSASDEWNQRNFLSTGSTLATFSKWSINFSGASEKYQNSAYEFGKNYALLVNAFIQTLPFSESHDKSSKFCLVSAPVLFQLEDTPELYDKFIKDRKSIEDIDFDELYHLIVNGRGIEKSLNLIKNLRNDSMNSLKIFTNSNAKIALENLVQSINLKD